MVDVVVADAVVVAVATIYQHYSDCFDEVVDGVDSAGSDNGDDVVAAVVVGDVDIADGVAYSYDRTVDSAACVVVPDYNDAQNVGSDFGSDTGCNAAIVNRLDVWQHRPSFEHNRTRDHVAESCDVMTDASVEQ